MTERKMEGIPEKQVKKKPKDFAAPPIRGSDQWRDWITELAEFDRVNYPNLIDRALALYAKTIKFPKSPPKR